MMNHLFPCLVDNAEIKFKHYVSKQPQLQANHNTIFSTSWIVRSNPDLSAQPKKHLLSPTIFDKVIK